MADGPGKCRHSPAWVARDLHTCRSCEAASSADRPRQPAARADRDATTTFRLNLSPAEGDRLGMPLLVDDEPPRVWIGVRAPPHVEGRRSSLVSAGLRRAVTGSFEPLQDIRVILEFDLKPRCEVGIRVRFDCGEKPFEHSLKIAFDRRPFFPAQAGSSFQRSSKAPRQVFWLWTSWAHFASRGGIRPARTPVSTELDSIAVFL